MVHRISRCLDVRKLMTKEEYDPNNDGKISLGIIDIDQDLNMGSHNIVLDEGAKVDGVDISEHTHSLSVTSVSKNPTLYSYSFGDAHGDHVLAELNHNFNTEHALISYSMYVKNTGSIGWAFWVRLYINDVKVAEDIRDTDAGEEHRYCFLKELEVDEGENIPVKVIASIPDHEPANLKGECLIVKSYELLPPSQS